MQGVIECPHCGGRGYYFFWSSDSRRQKWKMECPHCAVARKLEKEKRNEKKDGSEFVEIEF